jgi:hypothetical protein
MKRKELRTAAKRRRKAINHPSPQGIKARKRHFLKAKGKA